MNLIRDRSSEKKAFLFLLLTLATLKAVLLYLDPTPGLFMGDSGSYLATALTGAIPGDQSFVYGFFLRVVGVWPHSLHTGVWSQVALSTFSSWLLGFCLYPYFCLTFNASAFFALICALEPLQLLSEHYIPTETVATFLFACFTYACFAYLTTTRLPWLAFVQVVGVLLISIRISFLPMVLFASVGLPFMAAKAGKLLRQVGWRALARFVAPAVAFSLIVSQLLLLGYRHLYGSLIEPPMHGHPALFYRDGLFLASDFAPIIRFGDYPKPEQRKAVFGRIQIPLHDRR